MKKRTERGLIKPNRREVVGALASAGLAPQALAQRARPASKARIDAFLDRNIETVVVIYAENRSFTNLFSNFPGLQHPLSRVPKERLLQRDRDGTVLQTLPPIWGGLVPTEQKLDGKAHQIGQDAITGLSNGPFPLRTPDGGLLPHGL